MNSETKNSGPQKNRKKVVFIDWNKTLSFSLFWSNLAQTNADNLKTIETWLFAQNPHIIDAWMRGMFSAEEVCELIAHYQSLDSRMVFSTLAESCEQMTIVDEERIKDLIGQIRSLGTKVVIATDNMDTFHRFTAPSLNLSEHFDDILSSNQLRCLKYDYRDSGIPFFDDYLRENNLNYHDAVLIDDSIDRAGRYKSLGFDIDYIKTEDDLILSLESHTIRK